MNAKLDKKSVFFICTACVVIGCMILISIITTNIQYRKINDSIQELVQAKMEEYLGEYKSGTYLSSYAGDSVNVSTLSEDGTKEVETVNLTVEQQEAIIESVLGTLRPELYEALNNKTPEIQSNVLSSLEKQLETSISTVVEEKLETVIVFTDDEKEMLVETITVIVEEQMMEVLTKEIEYIEISISTLEDHVNNHLTEIETILLEYETKIEDMESDISNLKNTISSLNVNTSGERSAYEEKLSAMEQSLASFRKEYANHISVALTTSNIVTSLDVEPLNDTDVLSAKTGYEIKEKTEKRIKELETEFENNLQELEVATATKEELSNQKSLLEEAITATEAALLSKNEEDIQAAQKAFNEAISSMGESASEELVAAKEALQAAIDQNKSDLNNELTSVKGALTDASDDVQEKIETVNEEIASLSTEITTINQKIAALESEIENNFDEIESKTATKEELSNQKKLLEDAIAATETALTTKTEEDIQAAQAALNDAINSMGESASEELISAKEALQTAIDQNKEDLSSELTSVKDKLSDDAEVVQGKIDKVTEEIESLESTVTTINQTVSNNKQETDQKIADLENSMNTTITSTIDNLENGSRTDYQWSDDKTTLRITIP